MTRDKYFVTAVAQQDAVDVYVADSGMVCIAQSDGLDEPAVVVVAPESVIAALRYAKRAARTIGAA